MKFMKTFFLITFFLNGLIVFAQESSTILESWYFNGQEVKLKLIDPNKYVWASEKCQNECLWKKHYQSQSKLNLLSSGENPFNQYCKGVGEIIVSHSPNLGTLSFCQFNDGSFMSTNGFIK